MINVTIWNENIHEQQDEIVKKIYPNGMHNCIKEFLEKDKKLNVSTATMEEKDHGLTDAKLKDTNVLIWWGHIAHNEVQDKIVDRVCSRVLEGMGLLVLHSGHESKIFTRLVGTNGNIASYRETGEKERVWVCNPTHPITNGLDMYFEIEKEEMYSEPFQIPLPDETVFISWFEGGEVFRSGLCYRRGNGKIFYFRPGHQTFPVYYNSAVQKVISNSVHWVNSEIDVDSWKGKMERKIPIEPIKTQNEK